MKGSGSRSGCASGDALLRRLRLDEGRGAGSPERLPLRAIAFFFCSVNFAFGPRFSALSETFPGCQDGSASMFARSFAMPCFVGCPPPTLVTCSAMSPSDNSRRFVLLTVISAQAFAWAQGAREPSLPDTHHSGPRMAQAIFAGVNERTRRECVRA